MLAEAGISGWATVVAAIVGTVTAIAAIAAAVIANQVRKINHDKLALELFGRRSRVRSAFLSIKATVLRDGTLEPTKKNRADTARLEGFELLFGQDVRVDLSEFQIMAQRSMHLKVIEANRPKSRCNADLHQRQDEADDILQSYQLDHLFARYMRMDQPLSEHLDPPWYVALVAFPFVFAWRLLFPCIRRWLSETWDESSRMARGQRREEAPHG